MIGASGQLGYLRGVNNSVKNAVSLGWRIHFEVAVPVNSRIFIDPEIAISHVRTGSELNGINMSSIDIPLQFAIHLGKSRQWLLKAGPELSLALDAYERNIGRTVSVYQQIKQMQWYMSGTAIYLPRRVGLFFRYRHGFTKISDHTSGAWAGKFSTSSIGTITDWERKGNKLL